VVFVSFYLNHLGIHLVATAKNLTVKESQVQSVNLCCNVCDKNDSAVIKNLTGDFSTIISAAGVNLTQAQLKNNAINLLIKSNYPNKDLSSLTALAAKATYQTLLAKSSPAALPEMINEIHQNDVLDFAVKGLLLQYNALTLDDIAKGKEDECVKKYIEVHTHGAEESLIASRQSKPA
jgi:copper chaperone CopZ